MMKRWSLVAALACMVMFSWWAGCSNPNLAGGKLHFDQAGRLPDAAERTARFDRARETFIQAAKELPFSGEVRLWLGKSYAELGQPDSAARYFDLAVKMDSTLRRDATNAREHYWSILTNSGQTSAQSAQRAKSEGNQAEADSLYARALSELRRSMIYAPDKHHSYNMSAIIYYNLGQVDSAVSLFERSYDLSRSEKAEEKAKVEKQFFGILERQGDKAYQDAENLKTSGDSTAAASQYLKAQDYYTRAYKMRPEDSRLNYMLGVCAYQLSQFIPERKTELLNEAADRYQTVLKDNPADIDVLFNLCLLLRDVGRNEEAKEIGQRLVDLNPQDGTFHDVLARIMGDLGDKNALITGVTFGRVLRSGDETDPARAATAAQGGSDAKKRLLENGPAEQVLVYRETSGREYEGWFYWSRGTGYIFQGGKEVAQGRFAPVGALVVGEVVIEDHATSKVLKGTATNQGIRTYKFVRVEFKLMNENGEELGFASSSNTNGLDPKKIWNFEITLTGEQAKATQAQLKEERGLVGF